jgi:hypothetical protein
MPSLTGFEARPSERIAMVNPIFPDKEKRVHSRSHIRVIPFPNLVSDLF